MATKDEHLSIVGLGSYLPGARLEASEFAAKDDPTAKSPLFRAPAFRHHRGASESSADMVEQAARPMFERLGLDVAHSVHAIITNVLLPDVLITGCGAEVAARFSANPEWIIDLHNGGCGSFPYMMKIAQRLLGESPGRGALLCNVQNTAGSIYTQPEVRRTPQAAVPGDGCGVAYVAVAPGAPILAVETRHEPGFAADMNLITPCGRRYWEAGTGELSVSFDEAKFQEIIERGNRLIPEVVRGVCDRIDVAPEEIDVLVTNQPNRLFLRNWRTNLGVSADRHFDTFDRFGNLYGAGVPVTLSEAAREGRLRDGALIVAAGFAHAGDFAAAAAIRWRDVARAGS